MINDKKVVVVLPAYNAAKTLKKTIDDIDKDLVDEIVLVDDASTDQTVEISKNLNIKHLVTHKKNMGYGGNQKSCYDKALELNADIIVMLHPDYQYTPKLLTAMCSLIAEGLYPVVFASRILGKSARKGGMPLYKYIANRLLTLFQNILLNQKLSEYHTGYRAFGREVLEKINYQTCSNNFIFDNQICALIFYHGYNIAEVSCPTKYFKDASSINLGRSIIYGWGVLITSLRYRFAKCYIKTAYFKKSRQKKNKNVEG